MLGDVKFMLGVQLKMELLKSMWNMCPYLIYMYLYTGTEIYIFNEKNIKIFPGIYIKKVLILNILNSDIRVLQLDSWTIL